MSLQAHCKKSEKKWLKSMHCNQGVSIVFMVKNLILEHACNKPHQRRSNTK